LSGPGRSFKQIEQIPDGPLLPGAIGKRCVILNLVSIPATILCLQQKSGLDEIADDSMDPAFGDR